MKRRRSRNGVKARNISELKENFDIEKIICYFLDGKLKNWLDARYYEEEAEAIEQLDKNDETLAKKLCEIFDVEYQVEEINHEEIAKRNERLAKLKQFTADEEIIKNIDFVAFNQEELADLFDKNIRTIYLCEGDFNIPKSKNTLNYIQVGAPNVKGLIVNKPEKLETAKEKNEFNESTLNLEVKQFDEDDIFEDLADEIGLNDYVITDNYVVFKTGSYNFIPNNSLKTDEEYSEKCGSGIFKIWKIRENLLSTFTIPEYEGYDEFQGVSGNKVLLKNWRLKEKGVLVYDIDTGKATLECENWDGDQDSISSHNGNIAYIDKGKNLRLVNLETKTKSFIEHLESQCTILLKDDKLFYTKNGEFYMYDINGKSKQLLKGIEMSKQHMFFNNGNLFVKGKVGSFFGFGGTNKIVKLDTKNGKVVELLSEENPNFNVLFDPKCNWALKHLEQFH